MDDAELIEILDGAATAVTRALEDLADWGPAGTRDGQYRSDLAADTAAVAVLEAAGLGILSEESGPTASDREVVVVLDPVDGSTNAARGVPWYATSLCALDTAGPRAAVVVNQASGVRYDAVRGGGARRDGKDISPSGCEVLGEAIVAFSGYPRRYLGWNQYRCLGAAALDLCAVADGTLDAYAVIGGSKLGPWDYLGGLLVCREAGAVVTDARDEELVTLEWEARRRPLAAATPALLGGLAGSLTAPS